MRSRLFLLALTCIWPVFLGAQPAGEVERPAIPPGALDPQLPPRRLEDAARELEQHREAAPALQRYEAGDYPQAARLGEELLRRAPDLHALRFAVANSLAWTGRYEAALAHYRVLLGTPYETRGRLGMANVLRWRGQAEAAEPHYLAV